MGEAGSFLLETEKPEQVTAVRHALTAAGISYRTGLQQGSPPSVAFFVPQLRLQRALETVLPYLDDGDASLDDAPSDERAGQRPVAFPWNPVKAVVSMAMLHAGLVLWSPGPWLIEQGGLVPGITLLEPWRLLTSVFLHADLPHVAWNALSLLVFGVPVLLWLGPTRSGLVYFVSGIGGGVAALSLSPPGVTTLGSSGAVAGIFGAWIVLKLRQSAGESLGWRSRVRTLGIALLVLPSLLHPTTAAGRPISVGSHLGGLATGLVLGSAISFPMRARTDRDNDDDEGRRRAGGGWSPVN